MAPRMQALRVLLGCRAKRAPGSLGGDGVRALVGPAGGGARPIKKPLRQGLCKEQMCYRRIRPIEQCDGASSGKSQKQHLLPTKEEDREHQNHHLWQY